MILYRSTQLDYSNQGYELNAWEPSTNSVDECLNVVDSRLVYVVIEDDGISIRFDLIEREGDPRVRPISPIERIRVPEDCREAKRAGNGPNVGVLRAVRRAEV